MLEALDRPPGTDTPCDDNRLAGIDGALERLPAAQRRAVELRVLDELAYEEIGERLACSPLAARIRVSRGLAALRTHPKGGEADAST